MTAACTCGRAPPAVVQGPQAFAPAWAHGCGASPASVLACAQPCSGRSVLVHVRQCCGAHADGGRRCRGAQRVVVVCGSSGGGTAGASARTNGCAAAYIVCPDWEQCKEDASTARSKHPAACDGGGDGCAGAAAGARQSYGTLHGGLGLCPGSTRVSLRSLAMHFPFKAGACGPHDGLRNQPWAPRPRQAPRANVDV